MRNEKLISYIDGSYDNSKGGWGCITFHNFKRWPRTEICGSCPSFDSGQMEILACIKAIANIPRLYNIFSFPCQIEIRSDYILLVNFIKKYGQGASTKKLFKSIPRKLYKEFMELHSFLQVSGYIIKAKKVNKKDGWLNRVDKYAKYALNTLPKDNSFLYCIKEEGSIERIPDIHNNIPFKFQYYLHQQNTINWIKPFMHKQLVRVPTELINITEDIHLKTESINFKGLMKRYKYEGNIDIPIVIRPLSNGTYSLVAGISRLCMAKLLGFNEIPAFISNTTHDEFIQKYYE